MLFMYVLYLLYPFIYWWTYRLFPCLGYCEQCCYEHRCACIFFIFIFLFLTVLGLPCCTRAFSSFGYWRLLFITVFRLLVAVASLVAKLRLLTAVASPGAELRLLMAVASPVAELRLLMAVASPVAELRLERRLSSCGARLSFLRSWGLLLDQGSSPCSLHWQVDS